MKTLPGLILALGCMVAVPAPAQEGVEVDKLSPLRKLIPEKQLEGQATQQYEALKQQARAQNALVPATDARVQRLRRIAERIVPQATRWNERAPQLPWEVNLIAAKQVNAFCMPGGKIGFFTGILDTLKLTDDEIAIVMGHEIAHALREHGRERLAKGSALQLGAALGSAIFGLGDFGRTVVGQGAQLWMLKFSREDETEADVVGLDIAARAGYDPRAGIALWQKMAAASKGAPPQWLSTHPAGDDRIARMRKQLPAVLPLYARAKGTTVKALAPYKTNVAGIAPVN